MLRQCIDGWRDAACQEAQCKQGLLQMQRVVDCANIRLAFKETKNEARRTVSLKQLAKVVASRQSDYRRAECFLSLQRNCQSKKQSQERAEMGNRLRRVLLLKTHFKALERFRHMKVEKLENIRKVNEYLRIKRRKRALTGLKVNLDKIRTKEQNLRVACQFRLFRHPFFIVAQAFRALREAPIRREQHQQKLRAFRYRAAFSRMQRAVKQHKLGRSLQPDPSAEPEIRTKMYNSVKNQAEPASQQSKDNQAVAIQVF